MKESRSELANVIVQHFPLTEQIQIPLNRQNKNYIAKGKGLLLMELFTKVLACDAIPNEKRKDDIANVFLFHFQTLVQKNLTEEELYCSFLSCLNVFLKYSNDTTYLDFIWKIYDQSDRTIIDSEILGKYDYLFDFVNKEFAVNKKISKIRKNSSENIRLNADYVQKIIPKEDYLHKVAVALEFFKVCKQYDKYLYQKNSDEKPSLQEFELIEAKNQLQLRKLAESYTKTTTVIIKGKELSLSASIMEKLKQAIVDETDSLDVLKNKVEQLKLICGTENDSKTNLLSCFIRSLSDALIRCDIFPIKSIERYANRRPKKPEVSQYQIQTLYGKPLSAPQDVLIFIYNFVKRVNPNLVKTKDGKSWIEIPDKDSQKASFIKQRLKNTLKRFTL